jgi:AcrR family transcriptional regulator
MSNRTVDWAGLRTSPAEPLDALSLRERKKRLMRQQLSDTATEMFMQRGFEAVRVVEVAEACGVSEKTVYNYFPTKESLVLDRWDTTMTSLRTGLANPDDAPVEAALQILDDELRGLTSWLAAQEDASAACAQFLRFGTLMQSTPTLRAYQHQMTDELIAASAEVLARRIGMAPDDPEPQIAATALIGLWSVQSTSLRKNLDGGRVPERIQRAVTDDVERAAHLIDTGLQSLERLSLSNELPRTD